MWTSFTIFGHGVFTLRKYVLPLSPGIIVVFMLVVVSAEMLLMTAGATKRVFNSFAGDQAAIVEDSGSQVETNRSFRPTEIFERMSSKWNIPALALAMLVFLVSNEFIKISTEMLRIKISNLFRLRLQERILSCLMWENGEKRLSRDAGYSHVVYGSDAGGIGSLMLFGGTAFVEDLVRISLYTYTLGSIGDGKGWLLAVILLPTAMITQILVQLIFQKQERESAQSSECAMAEHQSSAIRTFGMLDKVVYLKGESSTVDDLLNKSRQTVAANARFQRVGLIKSGFSVFMATITLPLVFLLAFNLGINKAGDVAELQAIAILLIGSIGGLLSFPSAINQFAEPLTRLLDVLNQDNPGNPPEKIQTLSKRDRPLSLSINHIQFSYPGSAESVLKDVSFHLEKGETACLVAGSGSGKTTLARIIMGEWNPDEGNILIDEFDMKDIILWHRRELIGYLPAEQGFLKDTLSRNIAFGRNEIPTEKINRVVNECLLREKASLLKDEIIHDVEKQLSTGERRRVGVARLLCGKEPIWIFDEPTSGLDSQSEETIANHIIEASRGKTSLIITHDPQLFPGKRVIFLDLGVIVGTGLHDELLKNEATYRKVMAERYES